MLCQNVEKNTLQMMVIYTVADILKIKLSTSHVLYKIVKENSDKMWMENIDLPHSCWNVSQEEHRTNNTCEGYNNRLNKSISKIHPNVFELVAVLQKEESSVRVTLHQMEFGEPPKKRRRIYRNLNDKLKKVQLELTSGTRTMKSFLKVVGFLLKL